MPVAKFHCPFVGLSGCRDGSGNGLTKTSLITHLRDRHFNGEARLITKHSLLSDLGIFERAETTLKRMGLWLCGGCFKTHTFRIKCRHGTGSDFVSPPDCGDGVVRIVSRLGVPIIMDRMTTSICEKPYGRASFVRVLVEIDSNKPLVDTVELWYESLGKVLKLWVEYTWVPPRCEECKVFGHYLSDCARKVNTVSTVDKNGETVRTVDLKNGTSGNVANNIDSEEGWQTATSRRNGRGVGSNARHGMFGDYNVRKGVSNSNRGVYANKTNSNAGNVGTKDANNKTNPANSGTVGKLDETVVVNEYGESANKNKGNSNDGAVGKNVNRNAGNGDLKKDMVKNNTGNKNDLGASKGNEIDKGNDAAVGTKGNCNTGNNVSKKNTMKNNPGNKSGRVSSNGNKNDNGSKSGDGVNSKASLGATEVTTSNRFDLLGDEGVNEGVDPWKEVKDQVVSACNTGIPIAENILKGWNTDMVKFYTVKWNSRTKHGISTKQQLENEMNSLSHQIIQLNRNLAINSKLNAEKMLKHSACDSSHFLGLLLLFGYWFLEL
ncbi:hypothetical protein CTI12_AA556490 [Artemisia annua]|uniref:Zinc knuckle CX2CX4HX4C n=1 Tax=Artemisia annua TaxID=35608 RepID=A0A2U1KX92_ARTAN|nr:hypothetical protein CTI12_AA556490 [Artemisia annua]